ncbi:hypothetical protein [Micromonospora zhanjiangensis]|uniref:FXSXX-COOH protein n=1 Tax=Micromonospora zhanjiangensis TaxID=1522057 RepID=A0ABV8KJ44_9ACTN
MHDDVRPVDRRPQRRRQVPGPGRHVRVGGDDQSHPAILAAPVDITVAELSIESFLPENAEIVAFLRG